jgi:hypothetical protein
VSKLQFGSDSTLKLFSTDKYKELEKKIYSKIPEAPYRVIESSAVYIPLNKMFLNCLMEKSKDKEQDIKINEIKQRVLKNEEYCIGNAAEQFMNVLDTIKLNYKKPQ